MAMNDKSLPLISVIITTDVQDERLERTLASCINQSYGEFEIIVFVLREDVVSSKQAAGAHKHQIRYVSRKNSSESEARNDGLSQAVGDYVAFLSAGEELQSLWFEKAIKRFALSKVDAVQCATLYEQAQKTTGVHLPSDAFIGYYQRLLTDEQVQLSAFLLKRSVCAQFPPDKPLAGSWEFLIRTLQKRKVDVLPDYFGSIVHPYEDSRRHEKLKEYRKEQCEIMRTYYSRMRFSLRKVRQYFKIRRFCGR
jgi:glycosyltransferase involved in cell wall biosynthesis